MPRITASIPEEQMELIEELSGENGEYESKSAVVRNFINKGERLHNLLEEIDELESRLERKQKRIDQLEQQLTRRSQIESKVEDLPDKIRDTETYTEKRQRIIDDAGLGKRLKWKLFGGIPVEDDQEDEP
ncbi:MAG: hypothetical protein ABEK59_06880 [Halobacteria archaeon]